MSCKASANVTIADISDGTDGTGIASTKVEYQAGSSGTSAPTGTWSTSIPATSASAPYLWTRVTYTYTDGSSPKIVYSVGSTPEGIEVGGRNYILYGKGDVKKGFFTNFNKVENGYGEVRISSKKSYTGININPGFLLGCRDYEVGKRVTFSFDVMFTEWDFPEGSDTREWWIGQRYTSAPSGETGTGLWRGVTMLALPKVGVNGCELNKWVHVSNVLTIPEQASSNVYTEAAIKLYNSNADVTATVTMRIKNVKIEYGNKATDWTPAPEDVDSKIEEAQTTANNAQLNIDSANARIDTLVTRTDSLGQSLTSVTQTADKINWLVKSGTSSSNFTLTDRTATLITNSLVIKDSTGASTIISGGKMDINQIFAQDITATGTITGVNLVGATGSFTGNVVANGGKISIFDIDDNGITADFNGDGVLDYSFRKDYFSATIYNKNNAERAYFYMDTEDVVGSVNGRAQIFGNQYVDLLVSSGGSIRFLNKDNFTDFVSITPDGNIYTNGWIKTIGANGWYNESYGGGIYMDNDTYVKVYNGKKFYSPSEICASLGSGPGQFKAVHGNYGFFIRNDGANTYFMLTDAGNPWGTWNSLRPLIIENPTGKVTIGTAALFNSEISSNGNIYLDGYGKGVRWKQTWGQAGIASLSDGKTISLYSQKTGSTSWTNAITLINSNGEIQIPTKTGGGASGTWRINITGNVSTYSGTHKPLGSIDTDGQRVSGFGGSSTTVLKAYSQWGTAGASYSAKNIAVSSSDIRLKRNILNTNVNALDMINSIKVRQFDWIDNPRHQPIGFVADELEELDPLFSLGGGYDEDGNMDVKGVDTFYMMGYVVKGIQEICSADNERDEKIQSNEARVDSLQTQLNEAMNQIAELKKLVELLTA